VNAPHKRIVRWIIISALVAAGLAVAFWPRSLPVDIATVSAGPMQITVDDEGETRVVDVFVVSAPTAGRLRRIEAEPGDAVVAGETAVAELEPSESQLLDPRTEAEAKAQLNAATSAAELAQAELEKADVRIVLWQAADVVKVPLTALFRDNGDWALFIARDGRAVKRRVNVGVSNDADAQILDGVAAGEEIIVYPGAGLRDGVRISAR